MHTGIDDHSRIAYAEIHADETAATAVGALARTTSRFAARAVHVERVLLDDGSAHDALLWAATCSDLSIALKKTRPYRPRTAGKIGRFHRTMAADWAFARQYKRGLNRRGALSA